MEVHLVLEPQSGATYDDLLQVARNAEELGFDGFFRSDHYLTMRKGAGLPGPTDSWITLAGLARETTRLRLGALMSAATFRLPGPLAITVAQIDHMSGGRVELGMGAAWFEAEHTAYGIPFPPLKERFARLEEQLAIITGLWSTPVGQAYSFEGSHYRVVDSPALPKPLQQPRPPIVVGGYGTSQTPRLAATYADEFNLAYCRLDQAAEAFRRVQAACRDADRDPSSISLSISQSVCCARNGAELKSRANPSHDVSVQREEGLFGTPDEVVAKLRQIAQLGARRVYLHLYDPNDIDHLRLLATQVLPHVR